MFIVPRNLIGNIRWNLMDYEADGHFIVNIHKEWGNKHKYIRKTGCYYNYLEIK